MPGIKVKVHALAVAVSISRHTDTLSVCTVGVIATPIIAFSTVVSINCWGHTDFSTHAYVRTQDLDGWTFNIVPAIHKDQSTENEDPR